MIARPDQLPGTFAELHARLGGVPLERIRAKPAPGTATEEDLLKNTGPICELIDGVLVEKPVGNRESALALGFAWDIRQRQSLSGTVRQIDVRNQCRSSVSRLETCPLAGACNRSTAARNHALPRSGGALGVRRSSGGNVAKLSKNEIPVPKNCN